MPDSNQGSTTHVIDTGSRSRRVVVHSVDPVFGAPEQPGELGRLGPYRVQKKLGSGGMGAVYLGLDEALDRKVALKVMLPSATADPASRDRFLREARAAAAVKHDNVVTIYQVGEARGVPYIAMEFLGGVPLDVYLARKGRLTVSQALRVGIEAADGLAAAHEHGLVHRDIKPANLWLEAPRGRVKILDFGIARRTGEEPKSALTGTGIVVGTPGYMSPEQARGKKLDGRSDLFSLGVVLYQLTTGRMPFEGDTTLAVLTALAADDPPTVRSQNDQIPPELEAVIHRLLQKNPDHRPLSAAALAEEFRAIADGRSATEVAPQVVYVSVAATESPSAFEGLDDGSATETITERTHIKRGVPIWATVAGVILLVTGLVAGTAYSLRKPPVLKDPLPPEVTKPTFPTIRARTPAETGDPRRGLRFAPDQFVEITGLNVPSDGPSTIEGFVTPAEPFNGEAHIFGAHYRFRVIGVDRAGQGPRWEAHAILDGTGTGPCGAALTRGRRVHLAAVRGASEIRFYLDGKLTETRAVTGSLPPGAWFSIGGEGFSGVIDEVRVSSNARYERDFAPAVRLDADRDTLALYKFEEGQGNVLADASGNNRHGKIFGARWLTGADSTPLTPAVPGPIPGLPPTLQLSKEFSAVLNRFLNRDLLTDAELKLLRESRGRLALVITGTCPMTDADMATFGSFAWMAEMTHFDLEAPNIGNAGFAHLAKCRDLEQLRIANSQVNDEGLKAIAGLRNVRLLGLSGTKVTEKSAPVIAGLRSVIGLDLSNTAFGDEGLAAFKELPDLRRLNLMGTPITDTGIDHLVGSKLTLVNLQGTKVSAAAARRLRESLPEGAVVLTTTP